MPSENEQEVFFTFIAHYARIAQRTLVTCFKLHRLVSIAILIMFAIFTASFPSAIKSGGVALFGQIAGFLILIFASAPFVYIVYKHDVKHD